MLNLQEIKKSHLILLVDSNLKDWHFTLLLESSWVLQRDLGAGQASPPPERDTLFSVTGHDIYNEIMICVTELLNTIEDFKKIIGYIEHPRHKYFVTKPCLKCIRLQCPIKNSTSICFLPRKRLNLSLVPR